MFRSLAQAAVDSRTSELYHETGNPDEIEELDLLLPEPEETLLALLLSNAVSRVLVECESKTRGETLCLMCDSRHGDLT